MSLRGKRIIAGVYLGLLLFFAGNHYFHWNLTGELDKKILTVVTFVGVLCAARFGPAMLQEIEEYRAKQKQQRNGRDA